MKTKTPEIPSRLLRSLIAKECIVFLGAGVSCQAGLASWKETIFEIKEIILQIAKKDRQLTNEKRFLKNANFLEVVERFRQLVSVDEYNNFLINHFSQYSIPSKLHELIAKLPTDFYITTNFDQLMEIAIQKEFGYFPLVCTRYDQVANARSQDKRFIIKLHGTIQDISTIVFSESDYSTFQYNSLPLLDFLRSYLDVGVVLFIGYSLSDPDFRSMLDKSNLFTCGSKRDDFAIFKNAGIPEKSIWRNRGIEIINIESYDDLIPFLEDILFKTSIKNKGKKNFVKDKFSKLEDNLWKILKKSIKSNYQNYVPFGFDHKIKLQKIVVERIIKRTTYKSDNLNINSRKYTYSLPYEALNFILDNKKVILFSEPGGGKSFILQTIAY